MRPDARGGVKPGSTFAEMRAKARAGSLVKGAYQEEGCAGPGPTPMIHNAGQGSGIVQRTPIQTSRTGHDPTTRQTMPTKATPRVVP